MLTIPYEIHKCISYSFLKSCNLFTNQPQGFSTKARSVQKKSLFYNLAEGKNGRRLGNPLSADRAISEIETQSEIFERKSPAANPGQFRKPLDGKLVKLII